MIVFTIIFIISSYFLIKDFLQYKENKDSTSELVENVIIESDEEESINIDWKQLKNTNKDIIGWIRIENTNINYPILQDDGSLKYLKHLYDGKYNNNGSIFTINKNPFLEDITVLYGHNMKNRTMFSELDKYMDRKFLEEHLSIEIYTENQNYKATIFSCYSIGANTEENNIKLLDFNDEIEYYKNKSKHSISDVGEIEKILKLSTCSYLNNHTIPTDQRYFIVAKLEKVN